MTLSIGESLSTLSCAISEQVKLYTTSTLNFLKSQRKDIDLPGIKISLKQMNHQEIRYILSRSTD